MKVDLDSIVFPDDLQGHLPVSSVELIDIELNKLQKALEQFPDDYQYLDEWGDAVSKSFNHPFSNTKEDFKAMLSDLRKIINGNFLMDLDTYEMPEVELEETVTVTEEGVEVTELAPVSSLNIEPPEFTTYEKKAINCLDKILNHLDYDFA